MRAIAYTTAFRKDFKRLSRSPRHDMAQLRALITHLSEGKPLADKHRDHPLGGNWGGFRECHLQSDWLLIYTLTPDTLTLVRTGTHSELFD